MKRDLLISLILCALIAGIGAFAILPGQGADYDAIKAHAGTAQLRVAQDNAYISAFPKYQRDHEVKKSSLSALDMSAPEGEIEERFLDSLDSIVRHNGVGMRPISIDPIFADATPTVVAVPRLPGAGRRVKLTRAHVKISLVGSYAAILNTVSELSRISVLSEINALTLHRTGDTDGSRNPMLNGDLSVSLYRVDK